MSDPKDVDSEELYEMCRDHFNEPILTDSGLGRVIGYGEDAMDCYIIIKHLGSYGVDGKVTWHTCVGGYYWLTALKGQNHVKSTKGEDWDDYFRLDNLLALNGAPKEAVFRLDLRHDEMPTFKLG
jgi:hypothetical protein